jgi:hypothetical protein
MLKEKPPAHQRAFENLKLPHFFPFSGLFLPAWIRILNQNPGSQAKLNLDPVRGSERNTDLHELRRSTFAALLCLSLS